MKNERKRSAAEGEREESVLMIYSVWSIAGGVTKKGEGKCDDSSIYFGEDGPTHSNWYACSFYQHFQRFLPYMCSVLCISLM